MPKAVSGVSIKKLGLVDQKNWKDGFPFAKLEELGLGLEKFLMKKSNILLKLFSTILDCIVLIKKLQIVLQLLTCKTLLIGLLEIRKKWKWRSYYA